LTEVLKELGQLGKLGKLAELRKWLSEVKKKFGD